MQEFRRPDWCAHLIETQKTLTGLSEHDLLLLATVLTTEELEGFQVLGKAHDHWRTFQAETGLHKALKLDRGVKCPDLTKVKSVSRLAGEAGPSAKAPAVQAVPLAAVQFVAIREVPKEPVKTVAVDPKPSRPSIKTEVIVQSNESVSWRAKVVKVKWPILTFEKTFETAFQLLNVSASIQGQKYNLVLTRISESALEPRQAVVKHSPEAALFRKHLNSLKSGLKSKPGLSQS